MLRSHLSRCSVPYMETTQVVQGDGVQSVIISTDNCAPFITVHESAAAMRTFMYDQCDYWSRYGDRIDMQFAGYDMGVYGDNGEFIGTDGYPDFVGSWNDATGEMEWEQA